MDAVTVTSEVCNTFLNRFVLKGLPYGYGEIFSGGASGPVEGSGTAKPRAEASYDS